jgi:putative alpha-1,2-mannosidase
MSGVYTDMSLWDVHRTQFPWLLFHDPDRFVDVVKSIVLINRQGGYMPKWPFANGWTGCMIGAHANTVLADFVVKENVLVRGVNVTEIMGYMLRNANTFTVHDARPYTEVYQKLGYVPA